MASRPPMSPTSTTGQPENLQTLRFDTDVMELQKAMIAAIKELSYTINTMVISSLATNYEEWERIKERVTRQELMHRKVYNHRFL